MYTNLQKKGQFIQGAIDLLNSMGIENVEAIKTNLWDNSKYEEALDVALKCKERVNELVDYANKNYKPDEAYGLGDNDFYKNIYPLMISIGKEGEMNTIRSNQRLRTAAYTPEGRKMLCLRAMVMMMQVDPTYKGKNEIDNINYYAQNIVPLEMAKNVDVILKEAKALGIDKENAAVFNFIDKNKEAYRSASRFSNLKDIYSEPESIVFFGLEGKQLDKSQEEKLSNYQPEATKAFLENKKITVPKFSINDTWEIIAGVKPEDVEIHKTESGVGVLTGQKFENGVGIGKTYIKNATKNIKRATFNAYKIMEEVDEWYVKSSEEFRELKKELKNIIKDKYKDINAEPGKQISKLTEMAKAYIDKKTQQKKFNKRETKRLNAMRKVYETLSKAGETWKDIRNCADSRDPRIEASIRVSSQREQFEVLQESLHMHQMDHPEISEFFYKAIPAMRSLERGIIRSAVSVDTPEYREKIACALLGSSMVQEYVTNRNAFHDRHGRNAMWFVKYPGEYKFYDMVCKEGVKKVLDDFKNSPLMDFIIKNDRVRYVIRDQKSLMKEFEKYKAVMKVDASVDKYQTYKTKLNLPETATYDQVKAAARKDYILHHPDKVHTDDPVVSAEHAKAFLEDQKMYEDLTNNEAYYRGLDKNDQPKVNVEVKEAAPEPQPEVPKIAGLLK